MTSAACDSETKETSATATKETPVDRPLRRAMLKIAALPPNFSIEQGTARSTLGAIRFTRGFIVDLSQQDRQSHLRRTRWRRRGSRRAEIWKIHGRCVLRALFRLKKWTLHKTKHSCDHVCREASQSCVVVLHYGVEIVALDRDSVFRAFQLRLQLPKILRGGQLRIVLGHHQQPR